MSVTIRIYSRLHDKYDNLYADYSPLFKKLPAIAYYPPEDENSNPYFQGTVIVTDLSFIMSLMNKLNCDVELSNAHHDDISDLILTINDSMNDDGE